MDLTAQNVHQVFLNCMFEEGESTDNYILAEGLHLSVGFKPERLEDNADNITELLNSLPDSFKNDGAGMTFLNMCNDNLGNQWTDRHQTMDELVCLGIAIGKLSYSSPRELWITFPGGMPFLSIK